MSEKLINFLFSGAFALVIIHAIIEGCGNF